MELIIKTEIYDKYSDNMQICQLLKKKEKKFFKEIGYTEMICKNKEKFKKSESTCIDNNSCLFLKSNNFFEWLSDSDIIPNHDFNERPSITKKLQEQVWNKEFGAQTSGHCTINGCKNILARNISNSWQCGHIISHNNGGDTSLLNLRPLCTPCNKQMNDKDWTIYEDNKKKQIIIDDYFEDSNEINCMSKISCDNVVTVNTFFVWYYKTRKGTEKIKPVCHECYKKICF